MRRAKKRHLQELRNCLSLLGQSEQSEEVSILHPYTFIQEVPVMVRPPKQYEHPRKLAKKSPPRRPKSPTKKKSPKKAKSKHSTSLDQSTISQSTRTEMTIDQSESVIEIPLDIASRFKIHLQEKKVVQVLAQLTLMRNFKLWREKVTVENTKQQPTIEIQPKPRNSLSLQTITCLTIPPIRRRNQHTQTAVFINTKLVDDQSDSDQFNATSNDSDIKNEISDISANEHSVSGLDFPVVSKPSFGILSDDVEDIFWRSDDDESFSFQSKIKDETEEEEEEEKAKENPIDEIEGISIPISDDESEETDPLNVTQQIHKEEEEQASSDSFIFAPESDGPESEPEVEASMEGEHKKIAIEQLNKLFIPNQTEQSKPDEATKLRRHALMRKEGELKQYLRKIYPEETFDVVKEAQLMGEDLPKIVIPKDLTRPWQFTSEYVELIADVVNELNETEPLAEYTYEEWLQYLKVFLENARHQRKKVIIGDLNSYFKRRVSSMKVLFCDHVAECVMETSLDFVLKL